MMYEGQETIDGIIVQCEEDYYMILDELIREDGFDD